MVNITLEGANACSRGMFSFYSYMRDVPQSVCRRADAFEIRNKIANDLKPHLPDGAWQKVHGDRFVAVDSLEIVLSRTLQCGTELTVDRRGVDADKACVRVKIGIWRCDVFEEIYEGAEDAPPVEVESDDRASPSPPLPRASSSTSNDTLTFAEVMQRVRRVGEGSLKGHGSVYDVLKLISGNSCVQTTWRNMKDVVHELHNIQMYQFDGQGQRETPVAPVNTLIQIVWDCPGTAARAFRRQCADLIRRVFENDVTLADEIRSGASAPPRVDNVTRFCGRSCATDIDLSRLSPVPKLASELPPLLLRGICASMRAQIDASRRCNGEHATSRFGGALTPC